MLLIQNALNIGNLHFLIYIWSVKRFEIENEEKKNKIYFIFIILNYLIERKKHVLFSSLFMNAYLYLLKKIYAVQLF